MSWFRFCPCCAHPLTAVEIDDHERRKCDQCGWIQYRNPTVGVAVVLVNSAELLLGERYKGGWCIPCGHVEWGESIEVAAVREFKEETGLVVTTTRVLAAKSNFHDPDRQTVGIWFAGRMISGKLQAGGDLRSVGWFDLRSVPELVFPTDREVVEMLTQQIQNGELL